MDYHYGRTELPEIVERSERWRPERVPGTFRTPPSPPLDLAGATCGALPGPGKFRDALVPCDGEPLWAARRSLRTAHL